MYSILELEVPEFSGLGRKVIHQRPYVFLRSLALANTTIIVSVTVPGNPEFGP